MNTTFNDVFFADNQTGWAVGDNGVIVNTTDGGQNWTTQISGTSEILRAVFFIDANTGWAVGGQVDKAMIKTTDGGANWQSIAASNIFTNQMYDIAFADVNAGWLATYDSIFMTSDGGNTWVNEGYVSSVDVPRVRSIAVTSDTTAFVGGSMKKSVNSRQGEVFYRRPENAPFLWSNSGFNPSATDDQINSVEFINSYIGFAGGQIGKIYRKTDTHPGGPWELNLDLSSTGADMIRSISFPNEKNGMFTTSTEISDTTYALIYHTSDTGETWSAAPDTIQYLLLAVVHAPDEDNVGIGGQIYKGVPSSIGIGERDLNFDISIFPNPATDIINVEMNSESNELVSNSISDMTGRLVEKGKWN